MGWDYVALTAATNGPIVHPPCDIWAWRTTVEWCWQAETPDSSTRVLSGTPTSRAIYQQMRKIWAKEIMDFVYEISLSYLVKFFNMP
jgi:hypothetical protein